MPVYKQKLPSGKTRVFVKGQIKNVPYWETVSSVTEGKQRETELRQEIILKRNRPRTIKLADYIKADYLPNAKRTKPASYKDEVNICNAAIIPFFKEACLSEIDPRAVRSFQASRMEKKTRHGTDRKPATVNREMAVLSQIFTLAINDEILDRNPCSKVKRLSPDLHRIEFLTEEEENRLLAVCTGRRAHLKDLILVGINTGLRPGKSELFGLKVGNCDFTEGQIVLTKHKTATRSGIIRIIPMNSLITGVLLRRCAKRHSNSFVFIHPATGKPYGEFWQIYKAICKAAKLPKAKSIPYILRHTFGTRLAQAGVGIAEIKDLMGHKRIDMTMRYVHPTQARKREAVEKLVAKA